jgi:hypothetical protein
MTLTYAAASDLLERWRVAWLAFDGDAWVDLFTAAAEVRLDPFEAPLVGGNALRAYLLASAESQHRLDVGIERHWVVSPTILARWHASWIDRRTGDHIRVAAFMTLEVAADGRIERVRTWPRREVVATGPAPG